jgi:hypothetical protein
MEDLEEAKSRQDILTVPQGSQAGIPAGRDSVPLRLLNRAEPGDKAFRRSAACRQWILDDKVCVEVAKSFYSELGQGRASRSNIDRATVLALHRAVIEVRERSEHRKRPLLWAQYVHFEA